MNSLFLTSEVYWPETECYDFNHASVALFSRNEIEVEHRGPAFFSIPFLCMIRACMYYVLVVWIVCMYVICSLWVCVSVCIYVMDQHHRALSLCVHVYYMDLCKSTTFVYYTRKCDATTSRISVCSVSVTRSWGDNSKRKQAKQRQQKKKEKKRRQNTRSIT